MVVYYLNDAPALELKVISPSFKVDICREGRGNGNSMDDAVARYVSTTDADHIAQSRSGIRRFDLNFSAKLKHLLPTDRGFFRATYCIASHIA